jgi:hypothetical protein
MPEVALLLLIILLIIFLGGFMFGRAYEVHLSIKELNALRDRVEKLAKEIHA